MLKWVLEDMEPDLTWNVIEIQTLYKSQSLRFIRLLMLHTEQKGTFYAVDSLIFSRYLVSYIYPIKYDNKAWIFMRLVMYFSFRNIGERTSHVELLSVICKDY